MFQILITGHGEWLSIDQAWGKMPPDSRSLLCRPMISRSAPNCVAACAITVWDLPAWMNTRAASVSLSDCSFAIRDLTDSSAFVAKSSPRYQDDSDVSIGVVACTIANSAWKSRASDADQATISRLRSPRSTPHRIRRQWIFSSGGAAVA